MFFLCFDVRSAYAHMMVIYALFLMYISLFCFGNFGDLDLLWCGCVTFKYVKTVVLYYTGAHISIIIHTYMPHDPLPQSFKALPWKGSHQHVVFKFMNDSWDVPDLFFPSLGSHQGSGCGEVGIFPWRGDLP